MADNQDIEINKSFLELDEREIFSARPENSSNIFSEKDKNLITKAFLFSKLVHTGQLRKSGEPYLNHCLMTAINVAKQNMDTESIVASLLHDSIEDEKATEAEIKEKFGEDILFLIQGVTKLGKIRYQGIERHVESTRKFFIAIAEDIRVLVIKLCDRLHNVSTLEYVREDKRKRIAIETLEIYARLADRIGMGKLKAQLEDRAFPYAYTADYKKIKEIFINVKSFNEKYILKIIKKIEEELNIFEIKVNKIDYRLKHFYSLYLKMKKYDWDIEKIFDLTAMRIIVKDITTCYQVLGVIHGLYKPVPGRFKDYIAIPKANGYQSLHTTVFDGEGETFEIQIRTIKMHQEAEYGIASHLFYKEVGEIPSPALPNGKGGTQKRKDKQKENIKEKISWTKDLLNMQNNIENSKDYIEKLKTEFFATRLFVHTPKGDVIELPVGSGIIDFAYAIHSKIGDHIAGARINGEFSPLDKKLKNGDIVEILTSKNSKPSRKWIDYAFTTHTKRHIRNYIKENS